MLRYKLTEIISGYAHGRSGRTPEEAARSGQLCRGKFEATGCVERLNEFEATDMEPQEILHLQEPPIMCFECAYQGRPSHISCAYICENDKSPCRGRVICANDYCAHARRKEGAKP